MSESPSPGGRSFKAWWLLLLLVPLGLFAGRLIAALPVPAASPGKATVASGSSPNTTWDGGGTRDAPAPAPGGGQTWGHEPQAVAGGAGTEGAKRPDEQQVEPKRPSARGPVRWRLMSEAMDESRRTGRPLLLDFSADWCPPCQRMKREVFETVDYGGAVEAAVVPVSIVDRRRETGTNPPELEELQDRFGVDSFPTLVVFSPSTGRWVKDSGFGGADYTTQWIEAAVKQVQ